MGWRGIFGAVALMFLSLPAWAFHFRKHTAAPSPSPAVSLPAGLPSQWDAKIPLPPGAVVSLVSPPSGVVHAVEFTAPGGFGSLVEFYRSELPKAGFQLGPQVNVAAREAYSLNFSKAGVQDSLSLHRSQQDSSKFSLRIVYEMPGRRLHFARLRAWWKLWPRWWRPEGKGAAAAQ